MSALDFANRHNGQKITVDGNYPANNPYQCWDIGALYMKEEYGAPSPFLPTTDGSVLSTFNNFPKFLPDYLVKVVNNPNDPNQVPPVGSLVFWGKIVDPLGDVALCLDPKPGQLNFTAFCQNAPVGAPARIMSRSYHGCIGWLAPKGTVQPQPAPQPSPAPGPDYSPLSRSITVTAATLHVRADATTASPAGQANRAYSPDGDLHAGNVIQITGFKHSQNVDGNDVWLRTVNGHWVWSGGTNYHG